MKITAAIILLTCFFSSAGQDADKRQEMNNIDDFSFTISQENTEEDVTNVSEMLDNLGVKHSLKITEMDEEGKIKSLSFRHFYQDGKKGLGCEIDVLTNWTLTLKDGVLSCQSD